MMTALYLVEIGFGLGVAILVHEWGHFVAARWAGVRVGTFSLGFGPRLFGWTRKGTDFRVSAVPLGGYVKLAGEEWIEGRRPKPYELMAKPVPVRMVVYAAGVTMNVALAYVLFFGVLAHGLDLPQYSTEIGAVSPKAGADRAGLKAGDVVTAVAGRPVADWEAMGRAVEKAGTRGTVALTVRRSGRLLTLALPLGGDLGVEPRIDALVGEVMPMQPAFKAGIKAGDRLVRIGGKPVSRWSDVAAVISTSPAGKPLAFVVVRDGATLTVPVTPRHEGNRSVVGIGPGAARTVHRTFTLGECADNARLELVVIVTETGKGIWQIVRGRQSFREAIGGPVMMAQIGVAKAREGVWDLLHYLGFLNVQLMIANLLPIPVLDGGAIVLAAIEGVRRRRLSVETYNRLFTAGLTLLAAVLLFATLNDLRR